MLRSYRSKLSNQPREYKMQRTPYIPTAEVGGFTAKFGKKLIGRKTDLVLPKPPLRAILISGGEAKGHSPRIESPRIRRSLGSTDVTSNPNPLGRRHRLLAGGRSRDPLGQGLQ